MPLIDREHNANVLLLDSKHNGNVLLLDRKFAELGNDAECAFFPKLIKLVKKPFNLTKTVKEKPHCLISYSLACIVEPVRWPCFCFAEGLVGLTDSVAMGGVESRRGEVAIGFSG